jgi:hypothetical protein
MMSRTQPPSLDVGEGLGFGVGFFVEVGFGFGLPLVGLGLGAAVELGAGAVVAWLGDGAGAVVVGTDEVGSEAGSTTAVARGRVVPGRVAPVAPVSPVSPVAPALLVAAVEVSAEPQPSSEVVLVQSPPGSPGKPLDDMASSLQLSPDQ